MKNINKYKWGWLKDTVPIFILLILTFIFFSETLFQNKIFIHRDLSRFFYPLREFSIDQFRIWRIPLWDPYIHCGSPHLAELQTCIFYPLSIIYLLFSYPYAFNYFIIAHIFLAGLFTYLLMREWKYSRYAAFLSAAVFMFSGYVISVMNLLASLASVVWLPLVILFYERAFRGDWVRNSIITGIFLSLMFLGGEPVILYATVFILILFSSQLPLPSAGQRLNAASRTLILSLVIAAGLSCFQILPFMELVRHSSRLTMDFNEASMWSLPPYALLDLFVPYLSESDYLYKDYWTRQSWLLVYYMGVFTMICVFISLKFDTKKRRRLFFYIMALGLVLSFGRYTPIYYFLYKAIPGFELSRYPVKFFFMAEFSLAILAGMGLDCYRRNIGFSTSGPLTSSLGEYLQLKKFLKALLILACISSFLYLMLNMDFGRIYGFLYDRILEVFPGFMAQRANLGQLLFAAIYNIKRAIGYFMLLALLMFLPLRGRMKLDFIIPIIICVSLMDIFTANRHVYQNMDMGEYLRPDESVEFFKKDTGLFRIFNSPATVRQNVFVPEKDYFEGVRSLKERMAANRNISFGIYSAYGYGSLYNQRHEDVIEAIMKIGLPDRTNLLSLLNVKYVISPKDFKAEGYVLAKKGRKANIYENKNVIPRAFLAANPLIIKNREEILDRLKGRGFDPVKEVILEEDVSFWDDRRRTRKGGDGTNDETVNILRYSPNEVVIEAQVDIPRFLILSDSYYPGWKAFVDGRRTKIYRADYILRAVYLEPGRHIIKFTYAPFSFKIGTMITFITILIAGKTLWPKRRSLL